MTYILKEWQEQSRGKGLWFSVGIVALVTVVLLLQSGSYPAELGFEVFLLSLYDMNVYLIPLLSLFLASFAVMQEKEQKTLMILLTKKESMRSFLWKKFLAVQAVTWLVFVAVYLVLALPMKMMLAFHAKSFLIFLLAISLLLMIFNQIGLFLGSVCNNRIQLLGANIFVWFLMIFLLDLLYLYFLPHVTNSNIKAFSSLYFLDPLHAIHMYLNTSLGLFPLQHLSAMMDKLLWTTPGVFLLGCVIIWLVIPFELAVWLGKKGRVS